MASPLLKPIESQQQKKTSKTINEVIKSRQSSELVIALCGPLGCGIKQIVPLLRAELEACGYKVEHVSITSLLKDAIRAPSNKRLSLLKELIPDETTSGFERYKALQDLGNKIREIVNNAVLAKLAIQYIAAVRDSNLSVDEQLKAEQTEEQADEQKKENEKSPSNVKTAYIIDQLKHPEEATLLSKVYGSIFYLIGVLSKEDERVARLNREELIDTKDAHNLIDRDKKEDVTYGQKLEKTLELADYFVRNRSDNTAAIRKALARFIALVHGKNGLTPTIDEKGMYAAFSASLESACLSRQVGAAICGEDGKILSTGRNDVPMAGGGLYTQDAEENDHRCIHKGSKCYNDEYKSRLRIEILNELKSNGIQQDKADSISVNIVKNTQISSLIEYSRAIHAEMDAIVSLSRISSAIPSSATIYTTTYPCHNCARHIVAAGIMRVVYVQPYEKSLAEKLHNDSITSTSEANKVSFEPFEGVAPKRYQIFFTMTSPRKENGKAVEWHPFSLKSKDEEYIESYIDRELGVVNHLIDAIGSNKIPTKEE